jgi:hypothetical protein
MTNHLFFEDTTYTSAADRFASAIQGSSLSANGGSNLFYKQTAILFYDPDCGSAVLASENMQHNIHLQQLAE